LTLHTFTLATWRALGSDGSCDSRSAAFRCADEAEEAAAAAAVAEDAVEDDAA
jgi:hypothetical protein